jgi:hypothetical protein
MEASPETYESVGQAPLAPFGQRSRSSLRHSRKRAVKSAAKPLASSTKNALATTTPTTLTPGCSPQATRSTNASWTYEPGDFEAQRIKSNSYDGRIGGRSFLVY